MPLYEYECGKCGKTFELEHGVDEDPPRKRCPECRGKLRKVFNPVGIVFKGSGFYVNDSKKDRHAGGNGSTAKPAAPASGSTSDSTKPAADTKKKDKKESKATSDKATSS